MLYNSPREQASLFFLTLITERETRPKGAFLRTSRVETGLDEGGILGRWRASEWWGKGAKGGKSCIPQWLVAWAVR